MIITISIEPHTGADLATGGGLTARSLKSCAARKLARALVEAGAPDSPLEARGLDGRLRYTAPSLYAFSRKTLAENPRLRVVPWREFGAEGGKVKEEGP